MNVVPVIGQPLKKTSSGFQFHGGMSIGEDKGKKIEQAHMGLHLSSDFFSEGEITATFNHKKVDDYSCSEIVINYDPETRDSLHIGIPRDLTLISVRAWTKGKWETISSAGERTSLKANTDYKIRCVIAGSQVTVYCNGVKLIHTNLPFPLTKSQFGLFLIGTDRIEIKQIKTISRKPKAFVITQFSSPYNEVYSDVIKNICNELNVDVLRIDESMGPGLIVADIVQAIETSAFVIADVSPVNANVFYEVGYAHGIKKPTILIAEKSTKLPFDISPIRTLFYDNSISGKPKLEEGLRLYINQILGSE
jgi:hypothetical protein